MPVALQNGEHCQQISKPLVSTQEDTSNRITEPVRPVAGRRQIAGSILEGSTCAGPHAKEKFLPAKEENFPPSPPAQPQTWVTRMCGAPTPRATARARAAAACARRASVSSASTASISAAAASRKTPTQSASTSTVKFQVFAASLREVKLAPVALLVLVL